MNPQARRFEFLIWIGVVVTLLILLLTYLLAQLRLRETLGKPLPVLGQVQDFRLTNQFGQAVTLADLQGRVWVADIIFTRCAGPCPRMTRQMKEIQQALPAISQARLVTLTTDADFDTPPVLKAYAEKFGADTNRWVFLTGDKRQIANLAIDSLKLTAIEKKPEERQAPEDLFVHSTIFVVVDKLGRLRGVFETDGEGVSPATGPEPHPRRGEAIGSREMSMNDLPAVNAGFNALAAFFLVLGYYFIRRKNQEAHRRCMIAAFCASVLFLAGYLTYHTYVAQVLHKGPTVFRDPAWFRPIYLVILLTHTVLATVIVPMVLMTSLACV